MSEQGTLCGELPSRHQAAVSRQRPRRHAEGVRPVVIRADVSAHSTKIAQKLQDGTMPCDGPWPAHRVALFTDWLAGG